MNRDAPEIQPINEPADTDTAPGAPTSDVTLLTFRLAEQSYSLPIDCVEQIVDMVTVTHLPHAPAAIQGVINVHGRIVPVLDLRRRFNLPSRPYGLYTPIILAHMGDQLTGLIVDEVNDVHTIPAADLVIPDHFHLADLVELLDDGGEVAEAEARPPLPSAFLWAVAKTTDTMLLVLDVKAILTRQEKNSLSWALAENKSVDSSSR
jgi:purine-binding chemotaxis protein CheW